MAGNDADNAEMGRDLDGPNMEAFRNIMFQAETTVQAWGGQLYFVYLPEWARYANSQSSPA